MRLREKLHARSIHDGLTGLFNRGYMEEDLDTEIKQATRSNKPLSLIMLDLDKFKLFNDTYGHSAGDALLRELGSFLLDQVLDAGTVCRYGGEEFLIILPATSLESASKRAENIRRTVGQIDVEYEGKRVAAKAKGSKHVGAHGFGGSPMTDGSRHKE